MSETAISQLNEHIQKISSIHKKAPPKLDYLFHYNDAIKGYAAELTVFGRTYRSQYYRKKKTAKEAVSGMALKDQAYMSKIKIPPLQEEPLDEMDTSAWQSFAKVNTVIPPTTATKAVSPTKNNNNNNRSSTTPRQHMVQRVQRWLDNSLKDQCSKSYISLLNELVQVLAIEPARFTVAQAYHAIGGRNHAPYTATLFVDNRVFTTPEPCDTVQGAKNYCAYYAIVELVYDVCGVSVNQQQQQSSFHQLPPQQHLFSPFHQQQQLQQPLSPFQQAQQLQQPLSPFQQAQQLQSLPYTPPPPSDVVTRPLPQINLPPGINKRPIISTFNKSEMGMLNELASKLQWEIPTYDIEESIDERTKSPIFLCTITLQSSKDKQAHNVQQQQQQQQPYVIVGTQWCQSKNQAKHCTAARALEELQQRGLCLIVRD